MRQFKALGPPFPRSAGSRRRPHALIVDDNLSNQVVASAICEVLGYTCEWVSSGKQAIETAAHGGFDVVLMDICMPQMDGVEATLKIRSLPTNAALVPIIAVTANADSCDRARYLAAGMCAIVAKPIEIPALCAAMEQAIAGGLGAGDETRQTCPPKTSGGTASSSLRH